MKSATIWPSHTLDCLLLAISLSVIVVALWTGETCPPSHPAAPQTQSQPARGAR